MGNVGDIERIAQNRVVKLFKEKLGYTYLGNWEDCPGIPRLTGKKQRGCGIPGYRGRSFRAFMTGWLIYDRGYGILTPSEFCIM